jgi:hypothetical protein
MLSVSGQPLTSHCSWHQPARRESSADDPAECLVVRQSGVSRGCLSHGAFLRSDAEPKSSSAIGITSMAGC